MLLLDVSLSIASDREQALNEWYHLHVPRLVSVEGYRAGYRYVAVTPGPRYVALYEIKDHSVLPSLLGSDHTVRNPLTLSEWEVWDRELVPFMSDYFLDVYEPLIEAPVRYVQPGASLVIIRVDCDATHDDHRYIDQARSVWTTDIAPSLAMHEDVTAAIWLTQTNDLSVRWLHPGPHRHLLLVACAGVTAAADIANRKIAEIAGQLAAVVDGRVVNITAYHPIACHWEWS